MAAPRVDTRKLKDSVAEYLKKSKFEKAAETLELLVKAEPKDVTHRLKLGDAYRKLEAIDKAIVCYQAAIRHYSDQGQLIKAIAAVKVILEMDPRNETAQRDLAEMNGQRFAKPTLESIGLRPAKSEPPRAKSNPPEAASRPAPAASAESAPAVGGDDDEPLELDLGHGRSLVRGEPPPRTAGPPPKKRGAFDLGGGDDLPPAANARASRADAQGLVELEPDSELPREEEPISEIEPEPELEPESDLDPEVELEEPPEPAVTERLEPELQRDLAAAPEAPAEPRRAPRPLVPPPPALDELALDPDLDEPLPLRTGAAAAAGRPSTGPVSPKPSTGPVSPRPPTGPVAARPPTAPVSARPRTGPLSPRPPTGPIEEPEPIADLLGSDAEEEIELLSVSSDDDAVLHKPDSAATPAVGAQTEEIDAAVGAIAPEPSARPTPRVPLFDDLPQAAFIELVNRLKYRRFSPPQLILREGDPGRSFFVIVQGQVRVFKAQPGGGEVTLARLTEGTFFGEMALLSGAPRTASVAAEEETELLEITDRVLREVVGKFPQVGAALKDFYRQRLLSNVLTISPLFKDFSLGDRKAIVRRFRMRQARQGEVLVSEGSTSDGLYVVLHGAVSVVARNPEQKLVSLARLKEGDIFGEMSMLTREPARATVLALTNVILLRLPRQSFQELVLTHPQVLELVSALTERRKSATQAILRGGTPGADGAAFV